MNDTDHRSGSTMKTSVNLVVHNKEEEEGGDVQQKKIPQHTCGDDDADPGSDAGGDENCSAVYVQQCQRLKLKILKTKLENDLACKYYSKRQFAMLFLPLSCIGMLVSIIGFVGTGPNTDTDCEKSIDFESLVEGLLGAIIVFLSNLSKNLNFDAKAKHHQVVASQMKWLGDNADMLCHKISSTTQDGKSRKSNNNKKFKKLEEHFHMSQQSVSTVPPIKIAAAFRALEYDLKLSRSIQNQKLVAGRGGGDDDDKDDDLYTEFYYMELATILGERIYRLPNSKVSARMAIQNAKKMYKKGLDDSIHIGAIR